MSVDVGLGMLAIVGGHSPRSEPFQAVARVVDCSGVLVAADVVVTAGHCLDVSVTSLAVGTTEIPVERCWRHPKYEAGHRLHDIGVCRLAVRSRATPIPLDDGSGLAPNTPVVVAGFGRTGAFAHDGGELRTAATVATRVGPEGVDVGSADRTACPGDSGGPVLIGSEPRWRLAGLLRGATGAICGSPAQVVGIGPELPWLAEQTGISAAAPLGATSIVARVTVIGGALVVVMLLIACLVGRPLRVGR